jgi:hypothetical protein
MVSTFSRQLAPGYQKYSTLAAIISLTLRRVAASRSQKPLTMSCRRRRGGDAVEHDDSTKTDVATEMGTEVSKAEVSE